MPLKLSLIFNATTQAVNPMTAIAHSGGWSEGFWTPDSTPIPLSGINTLCAKRSPLLPGQCSIIGFRQALYTISGNRILPNGTSAGKVLFPGTLAYNLNLPQDSLELSGTAVGAINSNRFRVGALPDEMVTQGEYAPTTGFSLALTQYMAYLFTTTYNYGFIGRRLDNPTARLLSVTLGMAGAATVVLTADVGAVPGTSYIRFNRVYGVNGNAVSGSWLVTANPAAGTYVIAGYKGDPVIDPSGTARVDAIALFRYGSITFGRAVVKKIGRPSSSYRGRRSKRPVA